MTIIKKEDIRELFQDEEISGAVVDGILENSDLVRRLTTEVASIISSQIKGNVEFKKKILIAAIENSETKKSREKPKGVILQSNRDIKAALEKAEEKIGKALNSDESKEDIENIELDDLDDVDLATIKKLEEKGVRIIYPNLKYRKPKYENVGDILKYVESEDDKSAVKLVIMNFND